MAPIVDTLYNDITSLIDFLQNNSEISLRSFSDSNLRKNLLLASASYYENEVQRLLEEFTMGKTSNCDALVSFFKNKAIKRQYHTYFNWEARNVNSFLGLFGDDFKDLFNDKTNNDNNLKTAISSFLEIGRERNRLVHQNFGNYILEKTSEEIFNLHRSAKLFIEELESELNKTS